MEKEPVTQKQKHAYGQRISFIVIVRLANFIYTEMFSYFALCLRSKSVFFAQVSLWTSLWNEVYVIAWFKCDVWDAVLSKIN